jgi:hypothetical protein
VSPREPKRVTWAQVFAARVGVRRAGRVIAFVATYAATQRTLGIEQPTMEQYAGDWGMSYATAYRDLALFREAQPFFEEPAGFIAHVGTDLAAVVPAKYLGELG